MFQYKIAAKWICFVIEMHNHEMTLENSERCIQGSLPVLMSKIMYTAYNVRTTKIPNICLHKFSLSIFESFVDVQN